MTSKKPIFKVWIKGEGVETRFEVADEDDLLILLKHYEKIRKAILERTK